MNSIKPKVNGFTAEIVGKPVTPYRLKIKRDVGKIAGLANIVYTDQVMSSDSGAAEFNVTGLGLVAINLTVTLQEQSNTQWIDVDTEQITTIAIADAVPDAKLFVQAVNDTGVITVAQFATVYARYLEIKQAQLELQIQQNALEHQSRELRRAVRDSVYVSTGLTLSIS